MTAEDHRLLIKKTLEELAIAGYFAYEQQTGAAFREGRLLRYGKKGGGDLIVVLGPDGRHAEGEGKTGRATQKPHQKIHQKAIERRGGLYFVFRSPQELLDRIAAAGYPPPIAPATPD